MYPDSVTCRVCMPDASDVLPFLTGTGSHDILNQVFVPVLDDSICMRSDWYGGEFLPYTSLCAGYAAGGKDSCTVRYRRPDTQQ